MRSKLVKMRVANIGCIDASGVVVELDSIVCLVGANNSGKSTILRAYQAAVACEGLVPADINAKAGDDPAIVELWVHIPAGTENIDERWKESVGDLLLVRSKWEWPAHGGKPVRSTWDPEARAYADDGKAAGLDTVFSSRLPKPFRIGSLEDPAAEHAKLLKLVLEPIETRLKELMLEDGSDLRTKMKEMQAEAERPVAAFREQVEQVQAKVNESYKSVFSTADVRVNVSLGELAPDPGAALMKASRIDIDEPHGGSGWDRQGTGSQRALFWSMLEVRSELNRIAEEQKQRVKAVTNREKELEKARKTLAEKKKDDAKKEWGEKVRGLELELEKLKAAPGAGAPAEEPLLPGYMLLIDEPETALHPAVVRAAKEHLYALAASGGWQVMLATHHPCFVDPLQDNTTIVRLHRVEAHLAPDVYRADTVAFDADERECLKALLAFDTVVAEAFFGPRVIVVEGDTEVAAFTEVMNRDAGAYPPEKRPLLLRARGKATIPAVVKMLSHFKVSFAVVHDIDAPRTPGGAKSNPAYAMNAKITSTVAAARSGGVPVIHRCHCPNFEQHYGLDLPSKDKPYAAWKVVANEAECRKALRATLDDLIAGAAASGAADESDGSRYEAKLKAWVAQNCPGDPAYVFDLT